VQAPQVVPNDREAFFNEDRRSLSEAFAKFSPGSPGGKYVEACEFLASWLVGLGLHVSRACQARETQPIVEGTHAYEVMRDLVADEVSEGLVDHGHDLALREPVRTDASLFWETFLKDGDLEEGEEIDVYQMLQDGALLKMLAIRQCPAAVERAREIFEIVSRTVDGYA
jgi:hypothetical protein